MNILTCENINQYQQECEDAFKLECSDEDIKCDKEARKLFKQIRKQSRYVKRIQRLINKIIDPDRNWYMAEYIIKMLLEVI